MTLHPLNTTRSKPAAHHRRRRNNSSPGTDALPLWLRRFRVEVLLWAFRQGRFVDPVALTAVLGAKHARDEEPFTQWTRHSVRALLWCDVNDWCVARELPEPPPTTAATMWTLLGHLAATRGFAPGSDPLPVLRGPLVDSGGLDGRTGRPRRVDGRHPSKRAARP